jgi:hypothetical protein
MTPRRPSRTYRLVTSSTFWTAVAAIVAVVSVALFIVFRTPGPKLVARILYSDATVPTWEPWNMRRVHPQLGVRMPTEGNVPAVNPFSSYWRIAIENRGSAVARNVVLDAPGAQFFVIRGIPDSRIMQADDTIVIGDMRPHGRAVVYAWGTLLDGLSSMDPPRISHDAGVASIVILRPVGPPWNWLSQIGKAWFAIAALMLVAMAGGVLLGRRRERMRRNTEPRALQAPTYPRRNWVMDWDKR